MEVVGVIAFEEFWEGTFNLLSVAFVRVNPRDGERVDERASELSHV